MNRILVIVLITMTTAFYACGANSPLVLNLTTISPVNDAADQALDVAITATFSSAITTPDDWSDNFTLKKNNIGDSLCTDYDYDIVSRVVTCNHDDLEADTQYYVNVTGLTDSQGTSVLAKDVMFGTTE